MPRVNHGLMDGTMRLLTKTLNYRTRNHGVIATNLANIDTPGYEPKELVFEQELRRAQSGAGASMERTHPRHLPQERESLPEPVLRASGDPAAGGTSPLNLDREMARMAQNNLRYEADIRLLAKKFEALRLAIEERRR